MKKIQSFFFLSVLTISLFSCGDDTEELEADILGTWRSVEIILSECENPDINTSSMIACPGANCIELTFAIDSTDNRIYIKETISSLGSEYKSGRFSVGETSIEFCTSNEGLESCYSSKYHVSDNVLVLQTPNANQNCLEEIKYERME